MTLAAIIAQLPALSAEELDVLTARIKALRSLHNGSGSSSSADDSPDGFDLILHCAAETAQALGADTSTSFQLREAAKRSAKFREKIPPLVVWLRKACKTRAQQHALLCLAFKLLHRDMTRMGLPVTARTFLAQVHRLPAVINANFPDWWVAGLLHWIVEKPR